MEKIIELAWSNSHNEVETGDAIVEFVRYNEDGVIVNDILNIFLPENIHPSQIADLKRQASESFYNGEGFDL